MDSRPRDSRDRTHCYRATRAPDPHVNVFFFFWTASVLSQNTSARHYLADRSRTRPHWHEITSGSSPHFDCYKTFRRWPTPKLLFVNDSRLDSRFLFLEWECEHSTVRRDPKFANVGAVISQSLMESMPYAIDERLCNSVFESIYDAGLRFRNYAFRSTNETERRQTRRG